MIRILDWILGRSRLDLNENERVVALHKGRLLGIFGPGAVVLPHRRDIEAVPTDITVGRFQSPYAKALFASLPAVAARHLTQFRTGPAEIAVLERDGQIFATLGPDSRLVVWTDAGPWQAQVFDTSSEFTMDRALLRRLTLARQTTLLTEVLVPEGQAGLLTVDGVLHSVLTPGVHGFWTAGRQIGARLLDLKRQTLDVSGQEVLTRDRVTIRLNLSADYRVADPVTAATATKDFADSLYRCLQLAFRKMLGALSLDEILERKVSLDAEARAEVTAEMATLGIEVLDIALKDVILPGDMREILNQVVAAEKQAQANVIRRREETNATRALLNTAKVMAENPVMLRLKELEALEAIAGKVERLTIHNGANGLMNDIVRLRDA